MPLYDNIVDALELNLDGDSHVITVTNVGATLETNEAAFTGFAGVWLKFDSGKYIANNFNSNEPFDGRNVGIELSLLKTGGDAQYLPQVDLILVNAAGWNPASPDFTKLDYAGSPGSVGDGTESPSGELRMFGGSRLESGLFLADMSYTGVTYLFISDWNYLYHGSLQITYKFIPGLTIFPAVGNIHPDSTTAVTVGNRVRETFVDNLGNLDSARFPKTLRLDTTGMKSGLYSVRIKGQWDTMPDSNFDQMTVVPFRNGLPVKALANHLGTTTKQTFDFYVIENHETIAEDTDPSTYPNVNPIAPHMLVLGGDLIDFAASAYSGAPRVEIESIIFEKQLSVSRSKQFNIVRFEEQPVGFADQLNSGLEPDGAGWFDSDFVAMPNGDIYVFLQTNIFAGSGVPPTQYNHYFWFRKYTALTDTWSTIATGISDRWANATRAPRGGCSVATDGTDVYLAWWEWNGVYTNGVPATNYVVQKEFVWMVKKYDVSLNSFTALGSGQAKHLGNSISNLIIDWYPPQIEISPDGTIYVFTAEYDGTIANSSYRQRVYCDKWNGSSWVNTGLPNLSTTSETLTSPNSYVSTPIASCMGTPDGDLNYPCALYGYDLAVIPPGDHNWDGYRVRFAQYNGTTWESFDVASYELDKWWNYDALVSISGGGTAVREITDYRRVYSPCLTFANGIVYALFWRAGNSASQLGIYKLNATGTAFEEVLKYHPMLVFGDFYTMQPSFVTGPDDKPYICLADYDSRFTIFMLEDVGTGGMSICSDEGIPLYGSVYNSVVPRLKSSGNKLYALGQIRTWSPSLNYLSTFAWRGTLIENFDYTWSLGDLTFYTTVPLR